jgi:hypothetical protein
MRTYHAVTVANVVEAYMLGRRAGQAESRSVPHKDLSQDDLGDISPAQYYAIYRDVLEDLADIDRRAEEGDE